jgi:hypothetical protein
MKKFYVVLSTPSIEMTVKAKDQFGKVGQVFAGFKRYDLETSAQKVTDFNNLAITPIDPTANPEHEYFASVEDRETAMKTFLKKEILYLREVDVYTEEELGTPLLYKTVEDTRTEKDLELLGESNSCLDFLLDMLFASAPWGSSFVDAFYRVHSDLKLNVDAEIKN